MRLTGKLVSLAMVAALLAAPAALLASCLGPANPHPCCHGMAADSLRQVQLPHESPCCTVKSGKAAPISVAQTTQAGVTVITQPKVVGAVVPPVIIGVPAQNTETAAPAPFSQALLCTFLI